MQRPWEQWGAEGKVHHAVMRRTLSKGLKGETLGQEGEAGWLIGSYSLRVTFRLRGQRCWKYRIQLFFPTKTQSVHLHKEVNTYTHTQNPLYPSDQLLIITSQIQDEEKTDYETDGVIGGQIERDRTGCLTSNLNVLSYDCHWHSYKLACISTICQTIPLIVWPTVKGRPDSIMSQMRGHQK